MFIISCLTVVKGKKRVLYTDGNVCVADAVKVAPSVPISVGNSLYTKTAPTDGISIRMNVLHAVCATTDALTTILK